MYDIERYYQAVSVEDAVRALCADERANVISVGSDGQHPWHRRAHGRGGDG